MEVYSQTFSEDITVVVTIDTFKQICIGNKIISNNNSILISLFMLYINPVC